MSWFWRGAQSAVFYYLSCTPWFSYLHERRRGRERNQARAAKAGDDVEIEAYPHPLPSDTNPYWNEEMIMGPGLKRGRVSKEKAKPESAKRLQTGGQDSSVGDGSLLTFPSLDVLEPLDVVDESWNKKIYQRADEYLWGSDDPTCGSYASLSSQAANKPLVSGDGAYYNAQNPAVSKLHPPIISNRPKHFSQALWMTQPPPPAKLMEGKEREDRSRSVSNASYGSARGTGGAMAGRQASLRRLTGKLPDDLPDDFDPSPPEDDGENREEIEQQNHSMADLVNMDGEFKKRPPPIWISTDAHQRNSRSRASTLSKPPLSKVNSANEEDLSRLQVSAKHARSASPASSLQALQDLVPTAVAVQIRAPPPSKDARNTKLPFPTELEEQLLAYSFPFGQPATENLVTAHRWSMDI